MELLELLKLDKKYYLYDEKRICPSKNDKCHYHTNPLRRLIHDIHCYIIKCKYGRIENARR